MKKVLIIGGLIAAGFLGYYLYKKTQKKKTITTANPNTTATPDKNKTIPGKTVPGKTPISVEQSVKKSDPDIVTDKSGNTTTVPSQVQNTSTAAQPDDQQQYVLLTANKDDVAIRRRASPTGVISRIVSIDNVVGYSSLDYYNNKDTYEYIKINDPYAITSKNTSGFLYVNKSDVQIIMTDALDAISAKAKEMRN